MFFASVNFILLASLMMFRAIRSLLNAEPHLNILLFMVWHCARYHLRDVMDVKKHDVVQILVTVILRHLGRKAFFRLYALLLFAVASPGFITSFNRLCGLQTSHLNCEINQHIHEAILPVNLVPRCVSCLKLIEYIVVTFDDQYFCYDFDLFRL